MSHTPSTKKICRKCGQTKSLDQFHHNPNAADGRRNVCKQCRNRNRPPGPAPARTTMTDKLEKEKCRICGKWKPRADFPRRAAAAYGRNFSACKKCVYKHYIKPRRRQNRATAGLYEARARALRAIREKEAAQGRR